MSTDWIALKVGGETFETTRSTLLKYPESYFGALLGGAFAERAQTEVRIDRDAKLFGIVLQFLRTGKLVFATELRAAVREEFRFYNLPYEAANECLQRVTLYGKLVVRDKRLSWRQLEDVEEPCEFQNMELGGDLVRQVYSRLGESSLLPFDDWIELMAKYGFETYHLSNHYYKEHGYQRLSFEK